MDRLAEKGYLKKRAIERAHSYVPRMSREEFLRSVSEEFPFWVKHRWKF